MSDARVLARLRRLRAADAPTHGGRVLSYVYDSGAADIDALMRAAADETRSLNGLDPTVFPSVAAVERDVLRFVRRALHGGADVVGTATSGGTESCLLAVKAARDLWRWAHPERAGERPRLVAPITAHAAFQKAARLFDLDWDPVACDAEGTVRAEDLIARLGDDVALVVVSAPAYPSGVLDPVSPVAEAARRHGIACHVDACFGGLVLPWLDGLPRWDFRVKGVTSISADLHKFGYAPKGASVLLHRGRERRRAQFFATTRWPGYPVVNPTLLGSRSVSALAAAWAVIERYGDAGFREWAAAIATAAAEIRRGVEGIEGLRVMGDPVGPAIALVADDAVPEARRVDPHRLSDALLTRGWRAQPQPGFVQPDGSRIPHSVHLTLTPVIDGARLAEALADAADSVRGRPRARATTAVRLLAALGYGEGGRVPGPTAAWSLLKLAGAASVRAQQPMAGLMALIEELPAPVAEALLSELLARMADPDRG